MHLGHCSWEGVGGHTTLCISRAGVGASIFVICVNVGGSGWKLETQIPLSQSELILFLETKTRSVCAGGGEQLGGFLGVTGGWMLLVWVASLLFFARRWWKRMNIRSWSLLACFQKFFLVQLVG